MRKIRSRFVKLFISYVFLLVSIFLVYFYMTQSILYKLRSDTDAASLIQLEQTNNALSLWFDSYSDTSLQLSTQPELLRYKMLLNEMNASKGIEMLADVKSYDASLYDIFMYYDNNKIFSSFGLSPDSIYFIKTLECDSDSTSRALRILNQMQPEVHFLGKSTKGDGYILYHYPVRLKTDGATVSVNFLVSLHELKSILAQLLKKCDTYITVSFEDGEILTFYGNDLDELSFIQESGDIIESQGVNRFVHQSIKSEKSGTTLSVYYEIEALYHVVKTRQVICYTIIAVLLLFSVVISYLLSRKYHHPIHQLATRIACQREHNIPIWRKTDELDYLSETFGNLVNERDQVTRGMTEFKNFFRPQLSLMLFHGLLKEPVVILKMLELNDFEFHEDYFLALTVMIKGSNREKAQELYSLLQNNFREDLYSQVSIGGEKALSILTNIPNPDYTYGYRKKLEKSIRSICNQGEEAIISFSQIYSDITMISHAYFESVIGVNDVIIGRVKDKTFYYSQSENIIKEIGTLQTEILEKFEKAVKQQDEENSIQCLNYLLHHIEYDQCSSEMKRYLRYRILQTIIEAIQEVNKGHDRNVLQSEIMRINPADDEKYDVNVTSIVKRICFSPQKEDEIKMAIQYIHSNFRKYDLSLDEVADFVCLSKSYLSKLFKVKTGKRYIDYVSEIRLAEAKKYLTETQLSVQEIVSKVGYTDVTSFCKKFKAAFGVNTSSFRKVEIE